MYPENPEGTQVIVGSMHMGYRYIRHCQESNSQPVPSQADTTRPQWRVVGGMYLHLCSNLKRKISFSPACSWLLEAYPPNTQRASVNSKRFLWQKKYSSISPWIKQMLAIQHEGNSCKWKCCNYKGWLSTSSCKEADIPWFIMKKWTLSPVTYLRFQKGGQIFAGH